MTSFIIFSGKSKLVELPLRTARNEASFEVQETTQIGFRVDNPPEGKDFAIFIGDFQLGDDVQAEDFGDSIRWRAGQHLNGASGVTPISLRDAANGAILARSLALVELSKLSESAYDAMFEDMRRISVELLLDLISKSRVALGPRRSSHHGGVQPLTARLELSQIRRFWYRFSSILADILEDPHVELRQRRAIRRPRPKERLTPDVVRLFAQRGRGVRVAVQSGPLVELLTATPDQNTRENRVIVAFMDLLRRRVDRSLKRARAERDMRLARKLSFGTEDAALARFIRMREEPKIARLQEIVDACEGVMTEIRRAMRSFAVPVTRMGRQDFLDSFDGPFFRSHPRYARAARMMHGFLNNTAIIVEQGDAEGAKPIETIYEQWVFFQISAALQAAGLRCISHNSIFEPIARDRFSVDLDRNASIDFETADGRIVRLRYEPTILPRQAARGIDSIYRGSSASPWTPDILLEILIPGQDPRDYRLAYAAVIDAKYSTARNIWDRLQQIEKYREIRSVDTDSQIARQVWVVAPIEASIQPRDEAVTWSSDGEVGADPGDVILGVVGADPAASDRTGATLRALMLGVLNHAKAYARFMTPVAS
jgi:hypothetical protein